MEVTPKQNMQLEELKTRFENELAGAIELINKIDSDLKRSLDSMRENWIISSLEKLNIKLTQIEQRLDAMTADDKEEGWSDSAD